MINDQEWEELLAMRKLIQDNGITSFNTAYIERYVELFAKSLEGKGDVLSVTRSQHSMV
jgi:hypothetical protein